MRLAQSRPHPHFDLGLSLMKQSASILRHCRRSLSAVYQESTSSLTNAGNLLSRTKAAGVVSFHDVGFGPTWF